MKILTIPLLHHDTSFTIIEDGKITYYYMEERYSRVKHDNNIKNLLEIILKTCQNDNDIFDEIIFIRPPFYKFASKDKVFEIEKSFRRINHKKFTIVEEYHHIYHTYCGFYNSRFDESLCFSLDGRGALINNTHAEIETVFYLNRKGIEKCLYKKTFKNSKNFYPDVNLNLSVGEKFEKIATDVCNFSKFDSGKVMGLAQYKNYKEKLLYPYNTKEWKNRVDESYKIQIETQNYVLSLIKKYIEKTGVKNIVISGGYGLNCVANYFYLKNLKNINLYIDPVCFDAGISIGAAYYHYPEKSKIQSLNSVYMGHNEVNYDLKGLNVKKVSYEDVVDILIQKNIVALFQGKSEAGQRALGNRSLLFDPRVSNGKELVNRFKKRENFRPFGGTILKEEASKWFNTLSLEESPYMQYAMDAYENAIEKVPAIIHADNTCRIQTVTQKQNKYFYDLINFFYKRTGIPMLLNTSFNLGGEPLVETFQHAINTLKNSEIEYLYLPELESLVTIKNKIFEYK